MKIRSKSLLTALLLASLGVMPMSLKAQKADDPVIFEINGKKIYKSEFMKEFLRSAGVDPKAAPTACTYEKRQALEDYVDLFVNYRVKLEDAFANGYDTIPELVKELKGYRNELAAPYLIDSSTLEQILHEAYSRNHYTLHAAHILVFMDKNPSPEDTLKAYQKAMSYYNRVKNGEDFSALANEASQEHFVDKGLSENGNRRFDDGDLGNFTVFDMVYPFESAVYSLSVGEVSLPVRTNFGYHIIKLLDKNPYLGKCTFQHIWVASSANPSQAAARIRQAYEKIIDGESFASVCTNYTDDHSSADKGGLLSDLTVRQMPSEYVERLSRMKAGEMTEPFETQYGWHILKLVSRDSLASFEEMVPYYKQRLVRDARSRKPREAFVEQSKAKYHFTDYTKMYMKPVKAKGKKAQSKPVPLASLDECRAALSDSVFVKAWHYSDTMVTDMRPLFSVEDREYTAVDLLKFIESHQRSEKFYDLDTYLNNRYENFINDKVFEYADQHLEEEHNEFAELMDEYRNGLMIFSYNDSKIWSKAIKDTNGLKEFYSFYSYTRDINNEADAPYFWNERADIVVYSFPDSSMLAPAKAKSIIEKSIKKGWDTETTAKKLNGSKKGDAEFQIAHNTVEKEHQNILQSGQWRKGVYVAPDKQGYNVIVVSKLYDPCLKSVTEARGYYINEYQTYIENLLVKELRKKYNVFINQDVIDEITY